MKWLKRILIGAAILLLLAIAGFWGWATLGAQGPESLAQKALIDGNGVSVIKTGVDGAGFIFQPDSPTKVGLIFYSGGLVTPEAYAAQLRPIAEAGHAVFVPKMPLNLAVFDLNAADDIIDAHPEIEYWLIGGHSLGGAMAAQYTLNHEAEIDGLLFLASFPADGADLSNFDIEVMSIYGSNDGLATPEEILASARLLPVDTIFAEITGGNHAQFGDYGEQSGDNVATITLEEQIQLTVDAILLLLERVQTQ